MQGLPHDSSLTPSSEQPSARPRQLAPEHLRARTMRWHPRYSWSYSLTEALCRVTKPCSTSKQARAAPDQSKRPPDQLLHQTPAGRVAARDSADKLSVGPWPVSSRCEEDADCRRPVLWWRSLRLNRFLPGKIPVFCHTDAARRRPMAPPSVVISSSTSS